MMAWFPNATPAVLERAKKIKLVLTDCDGVLTDGGCYYSQNGEELKRFSLRDGMGIERLRLLADIETGFVTKEKTGFVKARAAKLRLSEVHLGVEDKGITIEEIAQERGLSLSEIAFMGDDVNDLPALMKAGLAACPEDSAPSVLEAAHFVSSNRGGHGAFRELAELILFAQGHAPAGEQGRQGQVFSEPRQDVLLYSRKIWKAGLVAASAGNVSARIPGTNLLAITPAAIPYDVMTAQQIAIVDVDSGELVDCPWPPSSELYMHLAIYRQRPGVGAVIHTHSPCVSVLSVLRKPLPPIIDEMIAYLGGTVEVADYAFTGTRELARSAVSGLAERAGVILANHGNVCVGKTLPMALQAALTMETGARVYLESLRLGQPVLLPAESLAAGRTMYEHRIGKNVAD